MHLWLLFALFAHGRAVLHPGSIPAPRSVMWVGAHPDDEVVAAPLLATWCRDQHARCVMVVLTRGESGRCVKPDGCAPDLATTRAAEAAASSQYFGATLVLLTLPNGDGASPPAWSGASLAPIVDAFQPELILTFDPRHGTTCHPEHRAAAELVLQSADVRKVYFLETIVDPVTRRFSSASTAAMRFDGDWDAVADDMQRHPSQFDAQQIEAIRNAPQAIFFAPAELMLRQVVPGCP